MINRYQGNSGKVSRYMEPGEQNRGQGMPSHRGTPPGTKAPARGKEPKGILGSLEGLGKMLPERIGELETEDIILLLILYLMYRESGDSELLIIMGAMFLL